MYTNYVEIKMRKDFKQCPRRVFGDDTVHPKGNREPRSWSQAPNQGFFLGNVHTYSTILALDWLAMDMTKTVFGFTLKICPLEVFFEIYYSDS